MKVPLGACFAITAIISAAGSALAVELPHEPVRTVVCRQRTVRTGRSAYHRRCYASESARQSCFRISAMEGAASRRKRAAPLTRAMVALGRHFEVPTRGFGSNGGTPAYVPATNAWKLHCARTRVRRYDEES